MSADDAPKEKGLVAAGSHGLSRPPFSNPLVSRALADLATATPRETSAAIAHDAMFYFKRGCDWAAKAVGSRKSTVDDEFMSWIDNAIKDLGDAIALNPGLIAARDRRALLLEAFKEDYGSAILDYDELICLDPTDASHLASRAKIWLRRNVFDKAIKDFDQAIALDPNNEPDWFAQRGAARFMSRDYENSIADFTTAIELAAELGWQAGEYDYSGPHVEIAAHVRAGLRWQTGEYHYWRGSAWSAIGEHANAVTDYRLAIRNLEECADQDNAIALLACLLATCPAPTLRDGPRAVQMALRLFQKRPRWQKRVSDILAAAYAEIGDFNHAVEYETGALCDPKLQDFEAGELRERLELYKARKPFHGGMHPLK